MKADFTASTIIMNKTEAKNAGIPTTDEFKQLLQLRTAFPDFSIVVRNEHRNGDRYKGLTKKFMLDYIEMHDGEKAEENEAALNKMLGYDKDGKRDPLMKVYSYGEIKMWFLEKHPEIEAVNKETDNMLDSIKEKRAKRRAAEKAA